MEGLRAGQRNKNARRCAHADVLSRIDAFLPRFCMPYSTQACVMRVCRAFCWQGRADEGEEKKGTLYKPIALISAPILEATLSSVPMKAGLVLLSTTPLLCFGREGFGRPSIPYGVLPAAWTGAPFQAWDRFIGSIVYSSSTVCGIYYDPGERPACIMFLAQSREV